MSFIQIGRVVTHRFTNQKMIITGIINDKFVVTQDSTGERYKLTVSQLSLSDELIEIKENESVDNVKKVFKCNEDVKLESDFDRFKANLIEKVKEGIVNGRIN
ncbi:ribosomal L14 [Tubulinosema ratisbonensis]|uniref:Ribosomal L14 n=1 Tax=Tubulinosema ratisbonensis TaxID=291195 RepID=A0A437AM84_9MICR|nr:ribosomal L14 [Tubulinosema ratisbonensis]